jgi:nucleotide-binding universal stress UspA family protein
MPNPILVAVDFDEASRRAVAYAIELAHVFRCPVVLLHVVPPTSLPDGTRVLPCDATDPVDLGEYVSGRAVRMLDEYFTSVLVSGVEVRREARSGHVVETVLHAIERCEASLLVVGTHGRTGAARLLLGSVAERLVRLSPIPVLVVRREEAMTNLPAHDSAFAGAAPMTGAIAGAATGALAGPAGAIAGAAIGTVIGAVAGRVMSSEDERTDAHDRDLDDAIGVTKGSLGAPPETKRPSRAALAEAEAEDRKKVDPARR